MPPTPPFRTPSGETARDLDVVFSTLYGDGPPIPANSGILAANPPSGNYDLFGSVFNVDNPTYGGNGNGVNDNLAAYNALLAAISQTATKMGGMVYTPIGRHVVSNKIQVTGSAIWFSGASQGGDIIASPRAIGSAIIPSATFPTGSPTPILQWNQLSGSVYFVCGGIHDMAVDSFISTSLAADGIYALNTYRWHCDRVWNSAAVQQGIVLDSTLAQAIDGCRINDSEVHNNRGTAFNQGAFVFGTGGNTLEAFGFGNKALGGPASRNAGVGYQITGPLIILTGCMADGVVGRGFRMDGADCIVAMPRFFNGTDLCCIYVSGLRCQITGGDLVNPNQGNGATLAGDKSCLWIDGCRDGNFTVGTYNKGTNSLTAIFESNIAAGQGNLYSQGNLIGGFSGISAITLQGTAKSKVRGIVGYNPLGPTVTTPGFPATTVVQTNDTGSDIMNYVTAGANAVTVAVDGTTMLVVPANQVAGFFVPARATWTPTYAGGVPTQKWYGL